MSTTYTVPRLSTLRIMDCIYFLYIGDHTIFTILSTSISTFSMFLSFEAGDDKRIVDIGKHLIEMRMNHAKSIMSSKDSLPREIRWMTISYVHSETSYSRNDNGNKTKRNVYCKLHKKQIIKSIAIIINVDKNIPHMIISALIQLNCCIWSHNIIIVCH